MDEPKRYEVLPESSRGDEYHVYCELCGIEAIFVPDDFYEQFCDSDGNFPGTLAELISALTLDGWQIVQAGASTTSLTFSRTVH